MISIYHEPNMGRRDASVNHLSATDHMRPESVTVIIEHTLSALLGFSIVAKYLSCPVLKRLFGHYPYL